MHELRFAFAHFSGLLIAHFSPKKNGKNGTPPYTVFQRERAALLEITACF